MIKKSYTTGIYNYFPNRKTMIQYVSNFLTCKYEQDLNFEFAMARTEQNDEYAWRSDELQKENVFKLEKILNKFLWCITLVFKNVRISPDGWILKIAFKCAGITQNPENFFPNDVIYKIEKNSFVQLKIKSH